MSDFRLPELDRYGGQPSEFGLWQKSARSDDSKEVATDPALVELKQRVHQRMLTEYEPTELFQATPRHLLNLIELVTLQEIEASGVAASQRFRARVAHAVLDELRGYGPLQPFLDDPEITEIMVNGTNGVFVERGGRLQPVECSFEDNMHVMRIIERIVAPLGRRIDESSPMVDARLPDGSRVNVIIPPLSLRGPVITIRKFARKALTIQDLQQSGTLSEDMLTFLRACVIGRRNILVSGGTGSGKTTTLNALSSFIPNEERIVTIEDAAELQLQQDHVATLESRPANMEGKGEVSIRMLVRNALRMRPDRIIVGEVRGGEALDMLQAMNTGHDGSLSTVHSNSPRDSLIRLETMTLMAGFDLPSRAIREQIASAIHLLVHQARLRDGSRRITHISEITGMDGDVIVLQDIFRWEGRGIDAEGRPAGTHRATGLRPQCLEHLQDYGIELPHTLFLPPEGGRWR